MTHHGASMSDLAVQLHHELRLLWRAHQRVGLNGRMCLYSIAGVRPWPAQTASLCHWFGSTPEEITAAVEFFIGHYHDASFPYTPLLLNPVVHQPMADGSHTPLGSGVYWTTSLTIAAIADDAAQRIGSFNAATGLVERGNVKNAGLKILAFSPTLLPIDHASPAADPTYAPNPATVSGGRKLYDLANIQGEAYWAYYLLSGVAYLSNAGGYRTAPLATMFPHVNWDAPVDDATLDECITAHTVALQTIEEGALCWERYDRHAALYERFGNNVAKLDENLKFFNYCARDFELFDAIGPGSVKSPAGDTGEFEFLVHGLIPRGSIILMAGTGGTGKSSLAHKLCCLAATDWRDDEQPLWLGQPLVKHNSKGICVYFSGEDGPAIINARNDIFDPEKRSHRLMFQRMHFASATGEEIGFAEFLARLKTMPEVPLLVIDPARKYLSGDEDDSAVVSEFFEAIEAFAHDKNAAVIVVHHLSKGARPKTARDVLDELRGSQVFIDRPRVVIGMLREGKTTIVGLSKCNIPPSLGMVTQDRAFAQNPKTLDLTELPDADAGTR